MSVIRGNVWKFGDDISTDLIISGKYKFKTMDLDELAKHAMEGADPEFSRKVNKGDIIVGGRNFGCGSSREQAPQALKHLGVGAIVAESFARIFYRNAINVGLPVVESEDVSRNTNPGDELEIDLDEGTVKNISSGKEFSMKPMPGFLLRILRDGGLVKQYKKRRKFEWE